MKTLLLTLIAFLTLGAPAVTYAAIDVDFQTTPLFGVGNFLPGDTVTKTVTVTNTGETTQDVYTELLNVVDGGLSPMIDVVISSGGALFSGSFDDFDDAGKVPLTSLASGDTIVYSYAMSFEPQAGNEYQNKSLGFDICIGFSGGQFECDNEDDPNYSQGSYGGYSQASYSGYSQGSYGGGYSQGSYGSYSQGSYGTDGNTNDDGPTPRVLGEDASNFPFGAPNTGFGGLLSDPDNLPFILLIIIGGIVTALVLFRHRLEKR